MYIHTLRSALEYIMCIRSGFTCCCMMDVQISSHQYIATSSLCTRTPPVSVAKLPAAVAAVEPEDAAVSLFISPPLFEARCFMSSPARSASTHRRFSRAAATILSLSERRWVHCINGSSQQEYFRVFPRKQSKRLNNACFDDTIDRTRGSTGHAHAPPLSGYDAKTERSEGNRLDQQVAASTRVGVFACCLVVRRDGAVLKTEAILPVYTDGCIFVSGILCYACVRQYGAKDRRDRPSHM